MNRTIYNRKNRIAVSKRGMWLIGGLFLIILLIISMFLFTKTVTAQGSRERVKRVTSVEIKKGDTLWSIASDYITEEYDDIHEYIKELKKSNGIDSDIIFAGNNIIVPYYADASE